MVDVIKPPEKVRVDLQTYLKKTMSKEITLNIAERDAATKLFNEFRGGLSQMALISEDVKNIVITKDEYDRAEKVAAGEDDKGAPIFNYSFKQEDAEKKMTVCAETIEYLRSKIAAKSEAKEFTFGDMATVSLDKKLSE